MRISLDVKELTEIFRKVNIINGEQEILVVRRREKGAGMLLLVGYEGESIE